MEKTDDSIPVFGFVGRITKQKGVHLILDIVEELVHTLNGEVQIIVGGPADMREEYSA
jgi:starch synthase